MIFDAQIKEKKQIAKDTWEITFTHNESNFYFNAGQYVWVITPLGRRAFSISSSSSKTDEFQIIFRHRGNGDFKKYLLEEIRPDLQIRGAYGVLRVPEKETKTVYIAGGVGVAPVMSILRRMSEEGVLSEVDLVFANSSEEYQFYTDELKSMKGLNLKFVIGSIQKQDIKIHEDAKYYIIGPQQMVDSLNVLLIELGIKPENIIFEENYPKATSFALDYREDSYFRSAVEQSINHIVMTDTNGNIVYANKAAEETTGYTFAEMQGQTPRLWGGMMDSVAYFNFWETIKVKKKPYKGEFRNQRKNGEVYTALAMVSPIADKWNTVVGFLGIEQDITQTKETEENLKKLTDLMVGRELEMVELKKKIQK